MLRSITQFAPVATLLLAACSDNAPTIGQTSAEPEAAAPAPP